MDEKEKLLARIANNHKHHPPQTEERVKAHEQVRVLTAACAAGLVETCPPGRELSLALTALEEAMMWANAAIARETTTN